MNKEKYKALLQFMIEKDIALPKAASILWQWKIWEEAKEEERYGIARGANRDAQAHLHKVAEMQRLQLEHYMVVANIDQELIEQIVRPNKVKNKE